MSVITNIQTFYTQPGTSFTTGDANNNIFYGAAAGNTSLSGTNNIGIGPNCLTSLTTGNSVIALGANAGQNLTTASNVILIGPGVCSTANIGSNQQVIGTGAGAALNSSSANNTLIGINAGATITSGTRNVDIGYQSGLGDTTCTQTTCIGYQTSAGNFSNSTALGYSAVCTAANQIMLGTSAEYVLFPGNQTTTGSAQFAGPINSQVPQSTVSGSTSGTAVFSSPFQGISYKSVLIFCNALNGTASYTFPTVFSFAPAAFISSALTLVTISSLTTTAITVSASGASTGFITLEGY